MSCVSFLCNIWNSRHSHTLFSFTSFDVIPFTRRYLFIIINFIENLLNWNCMDSSIICIRNTINQSRTKTLRPLALHFLLSSLDIWTYCTSPVDQIWYTTYVLGKVFLMVGYILNAIHETNFTKNGWNNLSIR